MKTVNDLVGKTIKEVRYLDPWGGGMHITFTDDTCVSVFERMQAGEFTVIYAEEELESDWHSNDD